MEVIIIIIITSAVEKKIKVGVLLSPTRLYNMNMI